MNGNGATASGGQRSPMSRNVRAALYQEELPGSAAAVAAQLRTDGLGGEGEVGREMQVERWRRAG